MKTKLFKHVAVGQTFVFGSTAYTKLDDKTAKASSMNWRGPISYDINFSADMAVKVRR